MKQVSNVVMNYASLEENSGGAIHHNKLTGRI
jgi:hypothetical protein